MEVRFFRKEWGIVRERNLCGVSGVSTDYRRARFFWFLDTRRACFHFTYRIPFTSSVRSYTSLSILRYGSLFYLIYQCDLARRILVPTGNWANLKLCNNFRGKSFNIFFIYFCELNIRIFCTNINIVWWKTD